MNFNNNNMNQGQIPTFFNNQINNNLIVQGQIQNPINFNNNVFINENQFQNITDPILNDNFYNKNQNEKITLKYFYDNIYSKKNNILVLPNILTIILNNNDNYNFILEKDLCIQKQKYQLISALCKINNEKYICYCISPYDEKWYRYEDGKINQVKEIDLKDIPLIVLYEQDNKIPIKYSFPDGIKYDIMFNKNKTVEELIAFIDSKTTNKKIDAIAMNGRIIDNKQILSSIKPNINGILDFIVYCHEIEE